jgi:hypothetical protein
VAVPQTQSLRIVSRPDGKAPGKHQQRFNTLIKKVAQLKRALQTWSHALPELYRAVAEYQRLHDEHRGTVTELVRLLDRLYADRSLTRQERTQLRDLIGQTAGDLLRAGGDDDLKAIYNKHTRGNFDAEAAHENAFQAQMVKTILQEGFGMDFDGADISSLDDLEQAAMKQVEDREREAAHREQAAEARRARRKKSPRQLASEARRDAETAQVGKTLQDVYRKLAMLLHPDHEQDPEERARKTLLMQEVNVAYERKDLLKLLELRLRFERVDEAHVNTIAEDRLVHFNTLLAEQVRQLQQELATVEEPWRLELDMRGSAKLTPGRVLASVRSDLRDLASTIAQTRRDLQQLQDPRKLKAWLRAARAAANRDFDRELEAWFGD